MALMAEIKAMTKPMTDYECDKFDVLQADFDPRSIISFTRNTQTATMMNILLKTRLSER